MSLAVLTETAISSSLPGQEPSLVPSKCSKAFVLRKLAANVVSGVGFLGIGFGRSLVLGLVAAVDPCSAGLPGECADAPGAEPIVGCTLNNLARPVIFRTRSRRSWLHTMAKVAVVAAVSFETAHEDAQAGGATNVAPMTMRRWPSSISVMSRSRS